MNIKTILSLLLVLVFTLMASTPLLISGLYTMHDDQQVARLFLFDEALKAGQFPPRWVSSLGFGFGYPLFIFYPPLVYFIGEIFHLIGFGFIDSIKIVFFLSIFLSGISMFILTRYLFGTLAALVGSAFYIFVPYRALDVYVRGALAESFSFVWLPLIIYSILKLTKKPNHNNAILAAIFLFLLVITHNLIFLPFGLILFAFTTGSLPLTKNKKLFIFYTTLAFIYAALLSAFFWIPALTEKKFTIVDNLLIVNLASYKIHFVYPIQLWNWTWGFGGSTAGILDGISFKIGKIHILISIVSAIIAALYLKFTNNLNRHKRSMYYLLILIFLLFALSAFMTTSYSQFVWSLIKPLAYLQFPWRFLTFAALFSSILAAATIYMLKFPALKMPVSIVLVLALILPNVKLFRPQYYRANLTDTTATSYETLTHDVSQSSFEYIPKGVELIKNEKGANSLNISKAEVPYSRVDVTEGAAEINMLRANPQKLEFITNADQPSNIRVNLFDFPDWEVYINGKKTDYTSDNKFKLITFPINEGTSQILLKFTNTFTRNAANAISAVSFLLLISYLIRTRWQTPRQRST